MLRSSNKQEQIRQKNLRKIAATVPTKAKVLPFDDGSKIKKK
jgi:hypothetical protein